MTSILQTNKRAKFDYEIQKEYLAGMSISSKLVKEIRAKKIKLEGKYVVFQNKQLQIIGLGNDKIQENATLLVTKKEKEKIREALIEKGNTCIVVELIAQKRWLKAKIAIAKGKKDYDKREVSKKRDMDRAQARGSLD
jgi:SsrA-binding protein